MLIRRVVEHQIEHDADVARVGLVQKAGEVFELAILGSNAGVVLYVLATI